ncbi:MAG: response regulator transcription factor [Planctomycetota bacterium]|jgi:two-component system response regulator FixJ
MKDSFKPHIFVVDNERGILAVVSLILEQVEYECTCFTRADDCIRQLRMQICDLLITDLKMPNKDGMELLREAKQIVPWLPVIMMTSYASVSMSVQALKAGAVNFIEKPLEMRTLLAAVESALNQNDPANVLRGKQLTNVEMTVLCLIIQGGTNDEIANILECSVSTIESHRNDIMRKLCVNSVVDLVKKASAMGLD